MSTAKFEWNAMLNFEPGTGIQGKVWETTAVDPNAWKNIFRKADTYQYASYSPKLMGPAGNYAMVMGKMLKFDNIESNPATHVISSGIRHLSKNVEILAECPAWTVPDTDAQNRVKALKNIDLVPAWAQASVDYRVVRLIFDADIKKQLASNLAKEEFWFQSAVDPESLQLEHVFECRFAGPLIKACTNTYQGDNTTEDALILLDRIINNPLNLIWAPKTLNAMKNVFFTSSSYDMSIKADKQEIEGLIAYLNNAAPTFKRLIETVVNCCIDQYAANSVIVKMLKVLYLSPFCQGKWEVQLAPVGGKVKWHIL